MDYHIPPDRSQSDDGHEDGNQAHQETLGNESPSDNNIVSGLAQSLAWRQECLQKRQKVLRRIMICNFLYSGRNGCTGLLNRQLGRNLGVDQNPSNDIDEIKRGQEEARKHGSCIKFDNRLSCNSCINNDHHRRRNQNTQRTASRNDARCQTRVVASVQHRPHGNHAHQHHHGTDQTTGNAPECANDQCSDCQRTRQFAERQLNTVEHLVDQGATFHDVAHEHKQWN